MRTERPLRRSTWTGLNSGQIRWTDAMAILNCAPCGPERSMRPLSGWAAFATQRLARPGCVTGARYGPLPTGTVRCWGRGGADTEDDAVYMEETDPFVCRRVACVAPPGLRAAPWGMWAGYRGGVAHSYLTPGRGWRNIGRTLANPGE